MNTILIPTDFSAAAENAMHYGAQMAQQLNCSITLLHVYIAPAAMYGMTGTMNEIPVMAIPFEDLKRSADAGLERCFKELKSKHPQLDIKVESRFGNAEDDIIDVAEEIKPLVIIMGSHHASGLERFIFGSTTYSIIRDTKYPVIAVPVDFTSFETGTVVLAADFESEHTIPHKRIADFISAVKATLHVVHVQTGKEEQRSLVEFEHLSPVYFTIQNEDVKEGLLRYVEDVKADMLMILPHEHNFMERTFFKLHAEPIINDAKIPVICIPA